MGTLVEIRWIKIAYGMHFVCRDNIYGQSYVDPIVLMDVVSLNHIKINI